MRLIDADELKKALKSNCDILCNDKNTNWCEHCCPLNDFEDLIDNAPTAHHPNCDICEDKAKSYSMGFQDGYLTSKERPQGEWLKSDIPESVLAKCSLCGFNCGAYTHNFCPNCGASMGVTKNETD